MELKTKLDFQYKILFLGDTSVGKTSLLIRYTDNKFDSDSLPTLGVDVRNKYVSLEQKRIRLDIWDSAGQERFRNLTKNFYHGANAIIFVYDITNKKTFETLKTWLIEAQKDVTNETEMIIVGNKIDLNEKREVNFQTSESLGKKNNIEVFESSAKTGEGVEEMFIYLIKKLFQNKNIGVVLPGDDEISQRRGSYLLNKRDSFKKTNNKENKKGCNC